MTWDKNNIWTRLSSPLEETEDYIIANQKLLGKWIYDNKLCSFEWSNSRIGGMEIINENGSRAQAYLFQNNSISIPAWNLTGKLSNDGNSINFSNNTAWNR